MEVRETLDKFTVRYEDDWPIPRTKYKKMYLDARNGTLNFHKVRRAREKSLTTSAPRRMAKVGIRY